MTAETPGELGVPMQDRLEQMRADQQIIVNLSRETVRARMEERKKMRLRHEQELRGLEDMLAVDRAIRDDAIADLERLNLACGLREDGTPRTPRGKQVGVTLEPAPPAIEDHPLIVYAADLPTGMISLGPDSLQITPDASPEREE
jgi:hypothetical protein